MVVGLRAVASSQTIGAMTPVFAGAGSLHLTG
jgi:hypothetical protein